MSKVNQSVEVAVAVLHYQERYLLAYRHKAQHQGQRFEFVGGKIEASESAKNGLMREVKEEIGLILSPEQLTKLGRISHDYGDKQVRLHIYDVAMTGSQYEQFAEVRVGCEGQPLRWVDKSALLAGDFPLPAANLPILTWLTLPPVITITHELAAFQQANNPLKAWSDFHSQHLSLGAQVYIRPKAENVITALSKGSDSVNGLDYQQQCWLLTLKAIVALLTVRADIRVILPELPAADQRASVANEPKAAKLSVTDHQEIASLLAALNEFLAAGRVIAQHCTHNTLLQYTHWLEQDNQVPVARTHYLIEAFLVSKLPIVVSCHDSVSIEAANKLANHRIQQSLPVVLAGFLSPVCATLTHPETAALGWSKFSQLNEYMNFPTIALGGLTELDGRLAADHGGVAIAGIRGFLSEI